MRVDAVLKWANRAVLLGLVSINVILITPPTLLLFRGSTFFRTTHEDISDEVPFKWPSLIICQNPMVKNQTAYEHFMQTYDPVAESEAFFTNVSDYLYEVAISHNHGTGALFVDPTLRWPLQKPYMSTFLSEYQYLGYCVEISLESIRQTKIQRGELKEGDVNSMFTAFTVALWLKETSEQDKKYFLDIVEEGELSLMATSKDGLLSFRGNHMTIFQLEFEREQMIDQCSHQPQDHNYKMSTCLQNWYQEKYPTNNIRARFELSWNRLMGLSFLANHTGCPRPCDRQVFQTKELFSSPLKYMPDPEMKAPFPNQNEGTLLLINHNKQAYFSKHQEQFIYSGQSYISDVGGISGIFLGISFWSLYELLSQTICKILSKCTQ